MTTLAADIIPAPKKSEPSRVRTLECERSADCDLAKRGQCSLMGWFQAGSCAHGQLHTQWGPTGKAASHASWIAAQRKLYGRSLPTNAWRPDCRIARTGDTIYLPYSFMGVVHPLVHRRVEASAFTARLIVKLCEGQPRDGYFNIIDEYQKKVVPEFVRHLLTDGFGDLLEEAAKLSPHVAMLRAAATQVGRTVLLATVAPNVGSFKIDGNDWTWDGTSLTSVGAVKTIGLPLGKMTIQVADPEFTVKLTDDRQITAQTVFVR